MLRTVSACKNYHQLLGKTTYLSTYRRIPQILPKREKTTIGNYLAKRIANAGTGYYYTVPGDFTLALLDEFLKEDRLKMINCCNELNAGYAADGSVRATNTLGVVVVTYMVGGLSAINAVAGAYSDRLPLLLVSGGPNIHDAFDRRLVHHTIGERNLYQQSECFEPIVGKTFVIRHPSEAVEMIDDAVNYALDAKKPVYLEIPCNLSTHEVIAPVLTSPHKDQSLNYKSDPITLSQCLNDILHGIVSSVRPIMIAGSKLKQAGAANEFQQLVEALNCAFAVMPDAKGIFSEQHPQYIGRFWGPVSSPHVAEIVESSDLIIIAGPVLNDYTTAGWSSLLPKEKILAFGPESVSFGESFYPKVYMRDILERLTVAELPKKPNSLQTFLRYKDRVGLNDNFVGGKYDSLSLRFLRDTIQQSLTSKTTLLTETGDSWFIGQSLELPEGCKYHIQMQYGSIGWSVGATLGVALEEGDNRRVLALIGDGSFQISGQEISTMIRNNVKATILLLNNDGYTIEVQIHDGPYNDIKMWNYTAFVQAIANGEGNVLSLKAKTNQDFADALQQSEKHEGFCLIECIMQRDDCTELLLEWGSRVAKSNSRYNI